MTVYRFFKAQGLFDLPQESPKDRRRFEAELPNDLGKAI
jgi:hypothetical protein